MKQAQAALSWSLTLYCPFCKELIWLEDHDEEGMYATFIFNNKWDNLVGAEVCCPHCDKEFLIKEVIY